MNSTGDSENFTSDSRDASSEVKFEREVNLGELQTRAIEKGELSIDFLPLLDQDGFIVKGWSHLLAAFPKTGKTELIVRTMAQWPEEKVLYITEEPMSVWGNRLRELPRTYQHVNLYFGLGASTDDLRRRIAAGEETVVILDTIRNLMEMKDEKDNSEVARALNPFIAASRKKRQTLILLHHIRKRGGKYGEGIAGGHAFFGAVDIAIELSRDKAHPRRRQLTGWGRVIEVPTLIYELREDNTMAAMGSPSQLELGQVKDRCLAALDENWQTTENLRSAVGNPKPSKEQITKALEELVKEEKAERNPPISEGKRQGVTYKWRRAQNITSDERSYRSEVKFAHA